MLHYDYILLNVVNHLSIQDMLTLEIALNKFLDNSIWRYKAFTTFSKTFWNKAKRRPENVSIPLGSWKKELVRIEKFQVLLEKTFNCRWKPDDFYNYWDKCDKLKIIFNV